MRINEILTEDQELNELSLAQVGRGIKTAAGKVGTGLATGAKVAGKIAGVPSALKTQFQAGKAATMNRLGVTPPASTPTPASPTPTPASPTPPTSTPPAIRTPAVSPNIAAIVRAYELLDPSERQKLQNELSIADDRARHASGTNESVRSRSSLSKLRR